MQSGLEISQADFDRLTAYIKERFGLNLSGKKSLVQSRLSNYVLDCGFASFSEYLSAVYDDETGRETANLINRLTTNHTYFMRETDHFRHFMNAFLPYAEKTVKDHDLRIWSAGCSFGNEPYNLAMCLDEYFGFRSKDWDLKILATDISFNALRSAANGIYTDMSVQNVPDMWKKKYFKPYSSGLWQVSDSIRSNVEFKYHNLMDDFNFKKKFDLILCRNVMIYFDEKTKSEICRKFYEATEDGGFFYIGHAESVPEDMPFEKVCPAVYRKTGRCRRK